MTIFGGSDAKQKPMGDMFLLNLNTYEWVSIPKSTDGVWPSPRFHHSAALAENGNMFLFGGATSNSDHLNDLFKFSFDTKQWTSIRSLSPPSPRAGHLGFISNNELYVFGGFSGKGGFNYLVDSYKLKLDGSTLYRWYEYETSGNVPHTARALVGAIDKGNNVVYVFGGYDGKTPMGELLMLNIATGKWKWLKLWLELDDSSIAVSSAAIGTKGTVPTPRYGHVMVVDESVGIITMFGGSGSMFLFDVFQIDVNPDE